MTQTDFEAFALEYKRLSAALERYKQGPAELATKTDAYFHVLKKFPLSDVIAKADTWLQSESKMPKPAEWAGVVVRRQGPEPPTMSESQAREYRAAELAGYELPPCTCGLCKEAGVSEKPLRFVPQDPPVKVWDPLLNRLVTAGHWAHGWELFRWYQARADFYNRCVELGLRGERVLQPKAKRDFKARLAALFPEKTQV